MRFPSIDEAVALARATATRFPLVILSGLVAMAGAWAGLDGADDRLWQRVVLSALLGIPLFLALALAAEQRALAVGTRLGVQLAGAIVPIGFFLLSGDWSQTHLWTRFFHLNLGLHLLVAVAPFAAGAPHRAFWQFNRMLFQRILLAALFTAVLFAGLSLALLALDRLFGIDIDGEIYLRLLWLLAFVFSAWYFAAGVPRDMEALAAGDAYPTGLRVFAQFILLPLVTVYLLILTAYLARVLITRVWPSGWIGWLVSGVAVAGTLALLLVHPLRTREDSRWVDVYGRWFYIALIPSIVMLLLAVGQRVAQYGFTERRYFLLVLALYLAGIALWYGITASRNIRIIPAALALVTFLTLGGPWSAYAVARKSQLARVESILERNGMIVDGRARSATAPVSMEDRREVSGAVRYLLTTHGSRSLRPLLGEAVTAEADTLPAWRADESAEAILGRLGIRYVPRWAGPDADHFFVTSGGTPEPLAVTGYDWLLRGDLRYGFEMIADGDTLRIVPGDGLLVITVQRNGESLITADLSEFVRDLAERYGGTFRQGTPAEVREFRAENERALLAIHLQNVTGRRTAAGDSLDAAYGEILLGLRRER